MSRARWVIRGGIFVVAVILLSQLIITPTSEPPIVANGLEWKVKSGDLLTFSIYVTGSRSFELEGFGYIWTHLNNTRIVANVIGLPTLDGFYNSTDFIDGIVELQKVSCTFENGTSLSYDDLFLRGLISMALFPTGSWIELDLLFSNSWNGEWMMYGPDYVWVSRLDEETFFFGHLGESWHFTKGWSSRINTTTGIPLAIEIHDDYHDAGFTSDSLHMDLVNYTTNQ